MHVFITGADGMLGSNVVRELLKRNHEVTALIQKESNSFTLDGLNINRVYGNILDKEELVEQTKHADAIIHCAACTNIWPARSDRTWEINVQGTENIIEAGLRNNTSRLVFVGTANSFGSGSKEQPGNEMNSYEAVRYGLDYMDSKHHAQEIILRATKEQGLPAIIVNPTYMIGPYDSKPSSGAMILALKEEKVPCYPCGGKNYICATDAAIGCVNALTMGRIGETYILGSENLSFQEMFSRVCTVVGAKMPSRKMPPVLVKAYGRINSFAAKWKRNPPTISYQMAVLSCEDHYYSAEKAVRELNLPQSPIETGILDCFDWFVKQGYIQNQVS